MFEGKLGQAFGPWGLLTVGILAGVMAFPALRKGARRLAVLAVGGMLGIAADEVKKSTKDVRKATGGVKGQLNKLVEEARAISTEKTAPEEG